MSGKIIRYKGNIFTNEGTTNVPDFEPKIWKVKDKIIAAKNLTVYYGHHGKKDGTYLQKFNKIEMKQAEEMIKKFKKKKVKIKAIKITKPPGMTKGQISNAVAKKHVLFTWCDSDTRVKDAILPKTLTLDP